jgi:hypothetical protein
MTEYRVCKNCPRKFPVTQETREFCSANCRKQWRAGLRELLRARASRSSP